MSKVLVLLTVWLPVSFTYNPSFEVRESYNTLPCAAVKAWVVLVEVKVLFNCTIPAVATDAEGTDVNAVPLVKVNVLPLPVIEEIKLPEPLATRVSYTVAAVRV